MPALEEPTLQSSPIMPDQVQVQIHEDPAARVVEVVRAAVERELVHLPRLRDQLVELTALRKQVNALRALNAELPEPWCKVSDVAAWLGVSSETVQRRLTFGARPKEAHIRARRLGIVNQVRCRTVDVYQILPKPESNI